MNVYGDYCTKLESQGLIRDTVLRSSDYSLDFSSVSYLCLHDNESVKNATIDAVKKYGVGATGSRILSGNYDLCHDLEQVVSRDKRHEDALLFSSGYNANLGLVRGLCDEVVTRGRDIVIFFDKMNHASLYHGVLSTNAKLLRYNNTDLCHLEDLLRMNCNPRNINIIISETVFGTNGMIVDVKKMYELSKKYGTLLILDEAHDLGMIGVHGLGITNEIVLDEDIFITGSFGKAIGVVGGYIISSKLMRRYLIQKSGTVIYSNNIPGHVVSAIKCAWDIAKGMDDTRSRILGLSRYMQERLTGKFNGTNIFSFELGSRHEFNNLLEHFRKNCVIACFFRPPTTPTYSIKVAINSYHTLCDIEKLINIVSGCI